MFEFLSRAIAAPIPFNFLIVGCVAAAFFGVIAFVACEARKFATHRLDVELKREMLEQGMSVEDIERALQAGRDSSPAKNSSPAKKR